MVLRVDLSTVSMTVDVGVPIARVLTVGMGMPRAMATPLCMLMGTVCVVPLVVDGGAVEGASGGGVHS